MTKYRVVETELGAFFVQERMLFIWFNLAHTYYRFPSRFKTVELARAALDEHLRSLEREGKSDTIKRVVE